MCVEKKIILTDEHDSVPHKAPHERTIPLSKLHPHVYNPRFAPTQKPKLCTYLPP